jgi:ABC-type multidrug transport system fused ATPase/permease subunit
MFVAIWVVTRRTQQPAATAGLRRQEELERMTRSIVQTLPEADEGRARSRFRTAVERVMHAEIRYGWLQAFNRQGSAGLAKLGPIAVVVAAAFAGTAHVGTLISLYLLAQRAFWGFDGVVDLSLATQSVRGAVNRCFEYIDSPAASSPSPQPHDSSRRDTLMMTETTLTPETHEGAHTRTTSPDRPVLSIRGYVPEGEAEGFIADALRDIRFYMQEHHVEPAGPPFSICRTRGSEIDVEAGWPVTAPLSGTGRIHGGAVPRSLLEPETA